MERSTKLKIAAGAMLGVTIIATVVAIIMFPPVAPFVATSGSALTLALGKEIVSRSIKKCVDIIMGGNVTDKTDKTPKHYHWTRVTEEEAFSKSGNRLTRIKTVEKKSDCDDKPKLRL